MKKIMFNDRYGLTQAVLEGRKNMTRRIIPADVAEKLIIQGDEFFPTIPCVGLKSHFKIGEVVAVAQSYESIHNESMAGDYWDEKYEAFRNANVADTKGWSNKMFVRADLMPHQIRITDIRIERLQDISEEDCLREGIEKDGDVYSFNDYEGYNTPQLAFKSLINRVSGRGTWEMNPYVFVYTFELVK